MKKRNLLFILFFLVVCNFSFLSSYLVGSFSLKNNNKCHGNEDRVLIDMLDEKSFFGVFDGHAGDLVSEYLKNNFIDIFTEKSREEEDVAKIFQSTFTNLDEELKTCDNNYKIGGSTAVVGILDNGKLFLANTGDSRAVVIQNNEIIAETTDHKCLPENDEFNRIIKKGGELECLLKGKNSIFWYIVKSESELQEFYDSLEYKKYTIRDIRIKTFKASLAISRTFGDFSFKNSGVIVDPDVQSIEINGNEILVLASDGLWDVFSSKEVGSQVCRLKELEVQPKEIAEELCDLAREAGSNDDITVIVVFFDEEDSSSGGDFSEDTSLEI